MRHSFWLVVTLLLLLNSCQHQYYYGLPDNDMKRQFPAEKMNWEYANGTVTKITVIGDENKLYRLEVTPKTKLQATTIYGEVYTFYLQKIKVEDSEGILGEGKSWTGYELHDHVQRTVYTRDIKVITILAEVKATDIIN
jgi:hypothetical protein